MKNNNKIKVCFLAIFLCLLNISASLASENQSEFFLPANKNDVVWKNVEFGPNGRMSFYDMSTYGYYFDQSGNKYTIKICDRYDYKRTKIEYLANRIYKMFGFGDIPQKLVNADTITSFQVNTVDMAIITKVDPNSKPLKDCSPEELASIQVELAKFHLISALIGNNLKTNHGDIKNKEMTIAVGNKSIYIISPTSYFTYDNDNTKPYLKNDSDFFKLIQPQDNWTGAKLLQSPFQHYTLINIDQLIAWLDSSWDESKVEALFNEIGIEDKELLETLKARFQNLKILLKNLKENGYEGYSPQKLKSTIKERTSAKQNQWNTVYKNTYYKFIDGLPKVEDQMYLCADGNKVWLELTNYEFLVNGKKSNQLVRILVGKVGANDVLIANQRYPIEIFDPETVYVFMKGVINYWDKVANPELAEAIRAGYLSVFYHFGINEPLDIKKNLASFGEISDACKLMQEKFAQVIKPYERLISIDTIKKRKEQGLTAYYPNPIYMGDIAIYQRPKKMSYEEYIEQATDDLRGRDKLNFKCDKNYLAKYQDIKLHHCDEYNKVLEKIYPDNITYLNNTEQFHFSDFNRANGIYAFRGEDRTMDDIYAAEGIWPRSNEGNNPYFCKTDKKKLIENESLWPISVSYGTLHHGNGPYISTSKILSVTKNYGKQVYVVLATGGLILPKDINGRKIEDFSLREIAVPGGIEWNNVYGTRERIELQKQHRKKYPIGPIYLKANLFESDSKNFWEILQIMGGKPQCDDNKLYQSLANDCLRSLDHTSGIDAKKIGKKLIKYFQENTGLSDQETQNFISKHDIEDYEELENMFCPGSISNVIGLEKLVPRDNIQAEQGNPS